MIGGALVVVGTFLPWLELNGRVRSGWGIYGLTGALGANPAVISPLFGGGLSDVFFTGIVTVALGILSLVFLAAVLITRRAARLGSPEAEMGLVVSATVALAVALVVITVNLRTARFGTQGVDQGVGFGLWATFAGGWLGTLGMAVSISGRRRIAARGVRSPWERSEREPAPGVRGGADVVDGRRWGLPGQGFAGALAVALFLVGIGGFVVASAADQSVQRSSAAVEATLGQGDPVVAARMLRTGFTSVNSAFNAYAAASQVVATARDDVTAQVADVAATSGKGGAGSAEAAKQELSQAIAAHGAAVRLEQIARQTYVNQLAVLMNRVHP